MTENTEQTLVLTRNFLFKWFIVGYLFLIVSLLMYIFAKDWAAGIAASWYGIDPETYNTMAIWFLAITKIFLIVLVLSPALALHWLICCCRKKGAGD